MKQTIYKGFHYTFNRLFPFGGVNHVFSFDNSCWYENSTSWNKVIGLSSFNNHKESIRLAWRPMSEKGYFHLAFYEYHKGERTIHSLFTVKPNEDVHVIIKDGMIIANKVGYTFKAKVWPLRNCFYFGGKDKAPHKMYINITRYDKIKKVKNNYGSISGLFNNWFDRLFIFA